MKLVEVVLDNCQRKLNSESDRAKLLTIVKELIAEGYDVDDSDNMKMTPLHVAVSYSLNEVAHELIKAGANINAQDNLFKGSPLHHAVKFKNIELVCMLLSYGADVSLLNRFDMTPFMYSLDYNESEITDILFNYYDDFSYENVIGYNALLLAAKKRNPLAITLLKAGADVNCCDAHGLNILSLSLMYEDAELFRLAWPQFDHQILMNSSVPFLLTYLRGCCFPATQWLECLYLILESDKAFDFIWNYLEFDKGAENFLCNLLLAFYKRNIEPGDRIKIIYICLSVGVEANFDDIVCAYKLYGFGDELLAFIYIGNHQAKLDKFSGTDQLLPTVILTLEQDYNQETVFESLKEQILYGYDLPGVTQNSILNTLMFFSLPYSLKKELCKYIQISSTNQSVIFKSVEAVSEIPSLVELCRNQTRDVIKHFNCIEKPYQFYDVLRKLSWPQLIKDIVCFKKPIYR